MAYMNQDKKKMKQPEMKKLLQEFGIKGSLSVRHHSTLVLTITKSALDFLGNYEKLTGRAERSYIQVNEYSLEQQFDGKCLQFMQKAKAIMNVGNHDNSDIQTDYFDVGWYIDINVGRWNKAYEVVK